MKDVVIPSSRIKRELLVLFVFFLAINILNIVAIAVYKETSWSEIFTELPLVCLLTLVLYVFVGVFRLLFGFVKLFMAKRKA